MNKKDLERLKRESEKREAKARRDSEDRQQKIKVLLRELKESPGGIKELAKDALGQALVELVSLQHDEIKYLRPFCWDVQAISKRFPRQWQDLSLANADAWLHEFYPWLEKHFPEYCQPSQPLSPKQKQEVKRRRQCAPGGVGLIEYEFGRSGEAQRSKSAFSVLLGVAVFAYLP